MFYTNCNYSVYSRGADIIVPTLRRGNASLGALRLLDERRAEILNKQLLEIFTLNSYEKLFLLVHYLFSYIVSTPRNR